MPLNLISIRRLVSAVLYVTIASSFSIETFAHDKEKHTLPVAKPAAKQAIVPLPFELGGPFELTDQNGVRRSNDDFEGRRLLVFFGYARCESICPVALKSMLDAVDVLGADGDKLQPILITVDPANETPAVLAETLPNFHPRLQGLTGSSEEIKQVRKLYRINAKQTGATRKGNPIFAHGSFVYLLDKNGKVTTLLPPIFDGPAMAEKLRPYL